MEYMDSYQMASETGPEAGLAGANAEPLLSNQEASSPAQARTEPATVAVCETQPITAEGLASILRAQPEFDLAATVQTLGEASELLGSGRPPRILVLDKSFGIQAVLDWMADNRQLAASTAVVVWGLSISEAEALRFLQAGAKGILRKVASPAALMTCLRTVAAGSSWMEDGLFREASRPDRGHRSELTPREQQVMDLVEQGHKNKDIAKALDIRPGTVKIHLKHIFEKTGVRGRYGLALSGLKDKGLLP